MGEIMEVFDDMKSSMGKKPFYILIGVAVVFGLYNLVKGSKESASTDELVNVTTVSSYPDAVTNANVIIDSIQNSIDYSENVIVEEIQGLEENMEENFEKTNDYINEGLDSQKETIDKMGSSLDGQLGVIDKLVDEMKADLSGTKQKSVPKTGSSGTGVKYYTFKKKSGLNSSTSIVDALKSIGVDSSMAFRKEIARVNNISKNYTGTYQENVKMLSMLKDGKLKQV